MQTLTLEAIILSVDKFGDHDAIVHLFTAEHGLLRGVVKRGLTGKHKADLQPATQVQAVWKARLPEHLGTVTLEARHSFAARVMHDKLRLASVGSMMSLLSASLAERDAHPALYQQTISFLQHVAVAGNNTQSNNLSFPRRRESPLGSEGDSRLRGNDKNSHSQLLWLGEYVRLELALLELSGFGLDLSECAATGTREELIYISPKSGRAVSREAGAPYHERMLALPEFLKASAEHADDLGAISAGLATTGHFIESRLLPALHRHTPPLRTHFVSLLQREATGT
ncbi:MAG: DNA repair protein RecO [Rickettsiales bacterium]